MLVADRIKDVTATTGTGSFTPAGGAPPTFFPFSTLPEGQLFDYVIAHRTANEVEVGRGRRSGASITREVVLSSSNAGALVNFSAGTKDVFATAAAASLVTYMPDGNVELPGELYVDGEINVNGPVYASGDLGGMNGSFGGYVSTPSITVDNGADIAGVLFGLAAGNDGDVKAGRVYTGTPQTYNTTSAYTPVVQVVGTTIQTSMIGTARFAASQAGSGLFLAHSRGSPGSHAALSAGDTCGFVIFETDDGAGFYESARIQARTDGAPASGSTPGLLEFLTTPAGSTVGSVALTLRADNSAAFGGPVTAGMLRLTNTSDLSHSSTLHALQIGDSAGTNTAYDPNEIMARNNGAPANLNFNFDGGNVVIGDSSSTVTISGIASVGVGSLIDGIAIGFRGKPRSASTSMTQSYSGYCKALTSGVTVPASVFNPGDEVTIYNNSGSAITITQGSGVTLRLAGTSTTGNRTLAQRGIASLWFNTATEAVCYGVGVT